MILRARREAIRGRMNVKMVPSPAVDETVSVPAWARTISLAM